MSQELSFSDYARFLSEVKERVRKARVLGGRAANNEMILLYWDIGQGIVTRQQEFGWGESVVDRLSADLQAPFPGATGFSPRNLRDMKRLYMTYADEIIWRQPVAKFGPRTFPGLSVGQDKGEAGNHDETVVPFLRQLVAKIPWGQNILILTKITDPSARLYYLHASARFGWSRNVLLNQIKAGAYERSVTEKKTHNFELALPTHLAEQADEMLKSRYNLEFLGIAREVKERELENRLVTCLQRFLLELAMAFASSAANTAWYWAARNSLLTCFFTTVFSEPSSRSILRSALSCPSMQAKWIFT